MSTLIVRVFHLYNPLFLLLNHSAAYSANDEEALCPTISNPSFFAASTTPTTSCSISTPRFVVHIDDGAIAKVGEIYASLLPEGGAILDLMSSWRSHLPQRIRPAKVVGLGLNRAEMEDNPALGEVVVHNVNLNPRMPFADESFDGAVMTVSVQYLIHPLEVFAEVGRVLKAARAVHRDFFESDVSDQGGCDLGQCERAAAGRPGDLLLYPERGLREDRDY